MIFDLDGTLVELKCRIEEVRDQLRDLFAPLGYAGSFRPILSSIEEAARAVGKHEREVARLRQSARRLLDRAECNAALYATARPGALRYVEYVVAQGHSFGIVTDNGYACVGLALEHAGFSSQFRDQVCIVTRDDVDKWKPSPEGLILAAGRLLPEGGKLWYIGDSHRDVAAGKAAQASLTQVEIITVAVDGGYCTAALLADANPDIHVGRIDQLIREGDFSM